MKEKKCTTLQPSLSILFFFFRITKTQIFSSLLSHLMIDISLSCLTLPRRVIMQRDDRLTIPTVKAAPIFQLLIFYVLYLSLFSSVVSLKPLISLIYFFHSCFFAEKQKELILFSITSIANRINVNQLISTFHKINKQKMA